MIPITPWLLPEYIEDVLPGEAAALEYLRRLCLDELARHGYAWVHPPLVEYLDTLLTGIGQDLNPLTFKVVDQRSGKTLGIRADMTPQVARIDAHIFAKQPINRLCYSGSVLHTQPSSLHDSREIWQLGAELYGSDHISADHEIIYLLLTLAHQSGLHTIYLDIGHVALFDALTADLQESLRESLFEAVQLKDHPLLESLTQTLDVTTRSALLALPNLYGEPVPVIEKARKDFIHFPSALAAIKQIEDLLSQLVLNDAAHIRLDLGELPSYQYHTGLVFSLYVPGQNRAIGVGGRYDRLGAIRGNARPATGFSLDLRALAASVSTPAKECIVAPFKPEDAELTKLIQTLREADRAVWVDLPSEQGNNASGTELPPHATHRICHEEGAWCVVPLH